jgi:hypothetical protein
MKLNTISPVLGLLKYGVRANEPSRRLYGRRKWLYYGAYWLTFALWWGFVAYLIYNYING